MANSFYLVLVVLGFLVLANCLLYLVLHCIYSKFRQPPGNLIAWQISALLLFCICVIYENLKIVLGSTFNDSDCVLIISIYTYT